MIGEADGEPLTHLTSIGIPPPPINLYCGLTPGKRKGTRETKRKKMDRCKGKGGAGREEMRDGVKERGGVHGLVSAKTQRSNLFL